MIIIITGCAGQRAHTPPPGARCLLVVAARRAATEKMSSFQEETATPARRASGASATSSRKSGASFGSAVSDYSYHDSEEESPLKEVYDDEKNLAEAIKASETEAQYDRIAKQLEGVAISHATSAAAASRPPLSALVILRHMLL